MNTTMTDLEIRISHQDASIEELTRVLLEQEKLIKTMQHDLDTFRQQLKEFSLIAPLSEETPPPHY
jgi:SlyX protein